MPITRPENTNRAFADAYNSGDVEQLVALYEPEAVLAPQPGQRAVGLDEIREALSGLMGLGGRMRSKNKLCMTFDDIAMLQAEWHLSGAGPQGEDEVRGTSAEVVRRQPDGTWLYVIDHPFGSDGAA